MIRRTAHVAATTARVLVMMVRPPSAMVLMLAAALGMASVGRPEALHPLGTTVLVIVLGWFVNATVLNDLADELIDRVNLSTARGRPLVSGVTGRPQLLVIGVAAAALSLATAAMAHPRAVPVMIGGLVLNCAYSLPPVRLSSRGLVAPLVLPLGFVALPFTVGVIAGQSQLGWHQAGLLGGLYVIFCGRVILKNFRDVAGDRLFAKQTFLLRHGHRTTCRVSMACWAAGTLAVAAVLVSGPGPGLARGAVALATLAFGAAALHGLGKLATAERFESQQVLIGTIAHAGRSMGVVLLGHYTAVTEGWSPAASVALSTALAGLLLARYVSHFSRRDEPILVRPY